MAQSILSQRLQQVIRYLFYFLFLTTPLIWVEANSELFELPKIHFVYAMSGIIVAVWVARMIIARQLLFKRVWYSYVLLLFIFSQLISTILSMHPHTSLFGYYTRFHGGLLSTLAYSGLFFAFINNFSPRATRKALTILISSSIICSLIALPEHFGFAFSCLIITGKFQATCWVQDIVTRVFGTFGQPNWLAAYLITLLPLVWAQLVRYKPGFTLHYNLLIAANLLIFSVVLFTKSRSGLLGLAVAAVIFGLSLLIANRGHKTGALHKGSLLTILVSLGLPLLVFGSEYTPSLSDIFTRFTAPESVPTASAQLDQAIPLIDRGGTDSGQIRQIVWQGAIDMFVHNFLFGTGVETFAYSYYQYRPVSHNLVSEWDYLYNKAHNEFLNIAGTTGIVGLGTYLGLMIGFAWLCYQGYRRSPLVKVSAINQLKKKSPQTASQLDTPLSNSPLFAGLLAGYAALAVSNALGFSTVSVGVLFFLFPAFALSLIAPKNSSQIRVHPGKLKWSQIGSLVVVGIVLVGYLYQIGRYYVADLAYASGNGAESKNDLTTAITKYQDAILLSPNEARFYNDYADSLSKAAYSFAMAQNLEAASRFAEQAALASAKTLELNPVHINFYKSQAGVFIRLAPLNPDYLLIADQILENALRLAPTDAKLTYNLGLIKLDQEATPSAQQYFEDTINLKPNYEGARMALAEIYEQQDEIDKALEQYKYILNYIAPDNSIAQKAVDRLESNEENIQEDTN